MTYSSNTEVFCQKLPNKFQKILFNMQKLQFSFFPELQVCQQENVQCKLQYFSIHLEIIDFFPKEVQDGEYRL